MYILSTEKFESFFHLEADVIYKILYMFCIFLFFYTRFCVCYTLSVFKLV